MENTEIKFRLKKNDQVQVMAGREKGKTGKVLLVNAKSGRVFVEKINMIKRHVKPDQKNPQGGLVQKEAGLHYSNVLLYCTKCKSGVRHGVKVAAAKAAKKGSTGSKTEKVRFCKRCKETIVTA